MALWVRHFAADRRGATAIEYALIAAFAGLLLYGGASALGPGFSRLVGAATAALDSPPGASGQTSDRSGGRPAAPAAGASSDLATAPLRP